MTRSSMQSMGVIDLACALVNLFYYKIISETSEHTVYKHFLNLPALLTL